jgi:hypothetical protein
MQDSQQEQVRSRAFAPLDPACLSQEGLFLAIRRDLTMQQGTCGHCAVQEKGRPERASEPRGADFQQARFLEIMASMGVELAVIEEYYCP